MSKDELAKGSFGFDLDFEAESALRMAFMRDPEAKAITVQGRHLKWALETLAVRPTPPDDLVQIGTRCARCGTAAPAAFAKDCNRPECEYRAATQPDQARTQAIVDGEAVGVAAKAIEEIMDGEEGFGAEDLARAALATQQPLEADVVGWQPIETAPWDGTPVDLWVRPYNGKQYRAPNYWWLRSEKVWRTDLRKNDLSGSDACVTHWRPIPAPPSLERLSSQGGVCNG